MLEAGFEEPSPRSCPIKATDSVRNDPLPLRLKSHAIRLQMFALSIRIF